MRIFITGASGYIGSQLVYSWLEDKSVEKIIALDIKEPKFLWQESHPKVHFVQENLADTDLSHEFEHWGPIDVVVHAAYFIRTPYFRKAHLYQTRSNIEGAENIFEFAFKNEVKKLIHFGTVASYGARKENSLNHRFKESDALKEEAIAYGRDKKLIEEKLATIFNKYEPKTETVVLRVGSVSGPFLESVVKKTGLLWFLKSGLPIVPTTSEKSARQYVHEDDVVGAVNFCLNHSFGARISTLNLAADCFFTFEDIAKILKKASLKIPHPLAKLAFSFLWHLSLGKIPTPPGTINSYSYPILVDGSKITKLGFEYHYNCTDALLANKGKFTPQKLP